MSTDNNTRTDSPFNIWWVVSGIGIVLVVVALILVLIFGRGEASDDDAAPVDTATSEPAPIETSDDAAASDSACGLEASSEIPTAAPASEWNADGLFVVPFSDAIGPEPLPDSAWSCFAHSPSGALFASAHYVAGLTNSDYEAFMRAASVDNASLATYLATTSPGSHKQEAGRVAQIGGFRFDSVDDNEVITSIALQDGELTAAFRIGMVWDDEAGTWKADVSRSTLTAEQADIATYTPWGAVNG